MKKLLLGLIFSLLIPCAVAANTMDGIRTDIIMANAESGDVEAQLLLAEMYQKSVGVTKDDSAAVQWYSKAADLGSVDAKYKLAQRYRNGVGVNADDKNPELAFAYAKNAAELGHPIAQYILGKMYLDGVGVSSNIASGMQWLTASAEQGNGVAQSYLGEIYMAGDYRLAKDWQKSVAWLKQASKTQKDPRVEQWNIGFMYHEGGYGISPDAEESMKWFAASGEDRKGAEGIVSLYYKLHYLGVEKSDAKAQYL